MEENHPSFGAVLRRLRTAAALSQEELADRAGVSARGISDLERGIRRAPRPETLRLLIDALGLGGRDREMLLAAASAEGRATNKQGPAPSTLLPLPASPLVGREEERAALALTETATRIADRPGKAVPDEIWDQAADHFNEEQLSAIILMISLTNFFNRINTTIEEPPGASWN